MENPKKQLKYFKNAELTRIYGVSDKAVRNWIDKAKSGRVNLELIKEGDRTFIADSLRNSHLLHNLAQDGRKYRNKRTVRIVRPIKEFYDLYTAEQILDIANSLEKHRETPVQYRYLGKGSNYWDAYLKKIYNTPDSYLTSTIQLLNLDLQNIDRLIDKHKYVNVIDIGVGNGLAAKELLKHIHGIGKLKKYIGIDISNHLLDKTERNIRKWFDNSILVEKYTKDIAHDRFLDVILQANSEALNIVLFVGGTITNFRDPEQPLKTIRDSIAKKDVLISTLRIDSEKSRKFFDYDVPNDRSLLAFHDRFTLDMLSIDRSFYDVEQKFDESTSSRYIRVRLRVDVNIEFELSGFRKTVEIKKGESILLIRMWHFTERGAVKLLEDSGFTLLRSVKSHDEEFLLLVSRAS